MELANDRDCWRLSSDAETLRRSRTPAALTGPRSCWPKHQRTKGIAGSTKLTRGKNPRVPADIHCRRQSRTGIPLGTIVNAATSRIELISTASRETNPADNIEMTSRISTVERCRPGHTRGPPPNCKCARVSCAPRSDIRSCIQRSGSNLSGCSKLLASSIEGRVKKNILEPAGKRIPRCSTSCSGSNA
jgi:hypothetical protein